MNRVWLRAARRLFTSTSAVHQTESLPFELTLESEHPDYLQPPPSRHQHSQEAPVQAAEAATAESLVLQNLLESYASVSATLGQSIEFSRVEKLLEFLKEAEVETERLEKCFSRYPELSLFTVGQLATQMEYFEQAGMKRSAIYEMLFSYPEIFGLHFQQDLQPIFDFFASYLGRPQLAVQLVSEVPVVLTYDLEREIQPKISYLRDLGLSVREIHSVIESYPSILCLSLKHSIQAKIEYLQHRLPEIQIQQAIVTFPGFLDMSLESHLKEKIDFFLEELRVDPIAFARYLPYFPQIFSCEIENNIKHKIEVLCLKMDIVKGKRKHMRVIKPKFLSFMACPSLFGFSQNRLLARMDQIRDLCFSNEAMLDRLFLQVPLLFGCTVEFSHVQSVAQQLLEALQANRAHFLKILRHHPQILLLSPRTMRFLLTRRQDATIDDLAEWLSNREAVKAVLKSERHLSSG